MTIEEIRAEVRTPAYDFLRTSPKLGNRIGMLCLGGSHAYGTNVEGSDIDLRGFAVRSAQEILTGQDWEQVSGTGTDTTVYSFDKLIRLLAACNPNTIEMLGDRPEHYLVLSPVGQLLLENRSLFLSKRAAASFGGYANAQLNRLYNKTGRVLEETLANETRSIDNAFAALRRDESIGSCISAYQSGGKPFISIRKDLPLDGFIKVAQTVANVHDDYRRSARNDRAVEHGKLPKHMMHLVRLYLMAFDILENGEIRTYREKDHELLMDIRNGKYLIGGIEPTAEFMEMVSSFEERLKELSKRTALPDKPDEQKILSLVAEVNGAAVTHCGLGF